MTNFLKILNEFVGILSLIKTFTIVIIIFIIFNFIINFVKRKLLKKVKTKKQISNVKIFSSVLKYFLILILVLLGIFSYAGSWAGLGLGIGLLSASLGWALQKPITGIAGWIMIVLRRPFILGDRIIIGNVRGDVSDITLTHIYLKEIGGIVPGEENSGRTVMIPNSVLFEQNIINYTVKNEYILSQVVTAITFESNLDKAIEIALKSAKKITKEFIEQTEKKPFIRTYFQPNGINVHVRYFAPAKDIQEISSDITKEIYEQIMRTKDVKIAYPHTEILLRKNK